MVLCVDRGFEVQHAVPLVSVAEERESMDGSGIAEEVFGLYDEFVVLRVGLHEVGQFLDALVGNGIA